MAKDSILRKLWRWVMGCSGEAVVTNSGDDATHINCECGARVNFTGDARNDNARKWLNAHLRGGI